MQNPQKRPLNASAPSEGRNTAQKSTERFLLSANPPREAQTFEPVIQLRAGQRKLVELTATHRLLAFVARRQYGKTTTFANIALLKMMRQPGHTVIFGSAKLNLSREIILKEAAVLEKALRAARQLTLADTQTGRALPHLSLDDFADLYEHSRLELRYYHDRGTYSRTKVVALRPDTVGETGDLMCDEIGRINNWREVWEAVEPIVASNPTFRLLLSTTVPPDDAHYSFSQLMPPPGTLFTPNPAGNLYTSQLNVDVLRLDAWDAALDGVPLYDLKTGAPLSPEEHRAKADDKDAWDRNYGCRFLTGGSAAVTLRALSQAQERGLEQGCQYAEDNLPDNFESLFGTGAITIGADPVTTEGAHSNPFGLCFLQATAEGVAARLILSMRTADPEKPRALLLEAVRRLKGRVQAVALDATSERFWCVETARALRAEGLTVHLCVSSTTLDYLGERLLLKTYLGNKAVAALEDGRVALPPNRLIAEDFRLVKRVKGGFDADVAPSGRHGDLFDAFKLALYAMEEGSLKVEAEAVATRTSPTTHHPERFSMRPPKSEQPSANSRQLMI